MELRKVLAVDFDGTLCENEFPQIGKPIYDVIKFVKSMKEQNWAIILWTCREDILLDEALLFCSIHGLYFDAVNENLPERTSYFGNDCRKIGADIYLDDKSLHPSNICELIRRDLIL